MCEEFVAGNSRKKPCLQHDEASPHKGTKQIAQVVNTDG